MTDTATADELATRLLNAGEALQSLRDPLVAGEPWPLSDNYGTEPEAEWGPREVLAHVSEMLPYWTEQLQGVLAGDPATAAPFGRVATDDSRLRRIADGRVQPTATLLDRINDELAGTRGFLVERQPGDLDRRGLHPTRGELTIRESLERFVVGHLEDHVAQLREVLGARPAS